MVDICYKPGPLSHSRRLRLIDPSALFYPKDKENALPLDRAAVASEGLMTPRGSQQDEGMQDLSQHLPSGLPHIARVPAHVATRAL
ncbi:hypothetical protein E2562_036957 [Oryza meyeriana var. granulata]|uniref:Uncharacterized protein n=1 Tax=Oryza meyeriana var. granulata TaxID=110450 RepID=A0A6G1ETI1_9ORYZ|nr:hypothetical protein E2562_036957 [Oryza meyeriana var. granulata]